MGGIVVEELAAQVDSLAAADPAALADDETLVALHRQLERLAAVVARADAAFDAAKRWEADGARSAAAWISFRCHLPMDAARRSVRLGRALRAMPATEEAWVTGEIGVAQADALVRIRRRVGEDGFDPSELDLVNYAIELRFRDFLRALAYWAQAADPDGTERSAQAQRDGRRVHLSQSFEGMWFLDGVLDPISGEAVSRVLKGIEDELFRRDWAEAKERLGEGVSAADLARTPGQRRADVLIEMARRAAAGRPAGGRMAEPLFTVLVGYETFAGRVCELASGSVVSPGALLPWLTEAWVERVVFDGPDRVKNVGVRRRLFSGATRRAVEVRARECFSAYCEIPAEDCEIDHVVPYASGRAHHRGERPGRLPLPQPMAAASAVTARKPLPPSRHRSLPAPIP
jgi:hypothetical protein